MGRHRVSRLNEQLRREITDIVQHQVRDPRIGMVTITDVRVTPDLDFARVFVTSLQNPEDREQSLERLHAAAPFIRGELGRRLRIRHTPELRFEVDQTLEHARRIEALLVEVRRSEQDAAEPGEAGSEGGPGGDDVA